MLMNSRFNQKMIEYEALSFILRHRDCKASPDFAYGSLVRSGKAKNGENRSLRGVNEHCEPFFNAAWLSAVSFRTKPNAHSSRALR
jgi:hypothetical protein